MLHAWERVFRQQRSRIKSGMTTELLRNDSCYMYLLKLWLCEPLYLPPLRGTFFQKKACVVPLQLRAYIVRDPSVRRSLTREIPDQVRDDGESGEPRRAKLFG